MLPAGSLLFHLTNTRSNLPCLDGRPAQPSIQSDLHNAAHTSSVLAKVNSACSQNLAALLCRDWEEPEAPDIETAHWLDSHTLWQRLWVFSEPDLFSRSAWSWVNFATLLGWWVPRLPPGWGRAVDKGGNACGTLQRVRKSSGRVSAPIYFYLLPTHGYNSKYPGGLY